MSLSFSKKNKCQGCKALFCKSRVYSCSLGFSITYSHDKDGQPWQPTPTEKCYKPKSMEEYNEARRLIKAALKNKAVNVA